MAETAAVRRAYDRWAAQYERDRNRTRDLNARILRRQAPPLAGRAVLEAGCGTGLNTRWLAARARFVAGLDLSAAMLRQARRPGGAPLALLQADVTAPWPLAARFDLVVATLILEHVRDLAPFFAEAGRLLRPGGLLYLGELHPYRQLQGAQATFADPESGAAVRVPAFRHTISTFVNGGLAAGFALQAMGEWRDAGDAEPRLLTLRFARPAG